ncbi:aldehyde dehydrogenase family protein [Sphingomonas sp. 22176]|uniref:aldehyde dehydrogenase family protein n=1 Tax=Sphingomonas sp. 22176 TaxID=3453884 RepID=UPI003F8332D3
MDAAVAAARAVFPGRTVTPIDTRRALLVRLADALVAEFDGFARLLTAEQGKPYTDARTEILASAYWLKGAATLDLPVTINEDSAERYSDTRRVPIGVVGAIAPWYFPMVLAMFKLGPALLAGNTVPGYFVPVTILNNPPEASRIVQEEQFGPVPPLLKFRGIDEVIARPMQAAMGWVPRSGEARMPRSRWPSGLSAARCGSTRRSISAPSQPLAA